MATTDSNFFELQRRGFQWNKNSTLDDEVSSMLWDSDPNDAVSENTDGETKLVAMPIGSQFMQSNGTLWLKIEMPNVWIHTAVRQTASDMEIYVATTGSDTTGDGSSGSPYATITRAYEDVPYTLRHPVQIHISTGTYTAFPEIIRHQCKDDGQLIFDGEDGVSDDEGDLTVASVTPILGTASRATAYDIEISGSPGWTTNEHIDKFMVTKDGTYAGHYLAIISNTADTLRVSGGYIPVPPEAADTVTIGSPLVSVEVATSVTVEVLENKCISSVSDFDPEKRNQIGFGFISFDMSGSGIRLKDTSCVFAACVIDANVGYSLSIGGGSINYNASPTNEVFRVPTSAFTPTVATPALGGVQFVVKNKYFSIIEKSIHLAGAVCRLTVFMENRAVFQAVNCSLTLVTSENGDCLIKGCYLMYPNGSHCSVEIYHARVTIYECYANSGAGLCLIRNSEAVIRDSEVNPSNVYYGILADAMHRFLIEDCNLAAAYGEVYYMQTATGSSLPAAGGALTDNYGGFIYNI